MGLSVAAQAQSFFEGEFDPEIPTLETTLGYEPGARITSPEDAATYIRALAKAAPDRVRIVEYARSWQGRPLHYVILTSAQNMARIETIQADLANIGAGRPGNGAALPVTWLAYSVHGNEISSTDAGLMLAYQLLAAEGDPRVDKIMNETIVIIDPLQNPDGRARFVHNFRTALGLAPTGDRQAAEHDEPWPSGRVNHYMMDLNRDWFALTQPESRGKVQAILDWHPVVVKDIHEMGGDSSYFFAPAARPINPNITEAQLRGHSIIGRNNARYMDAMGEPYFTREVYDLFYPGYGDTWNSHQGAVGGTYEQGSARGLLWTRSDGSTLTYGDTVRNQFVTSFSAAEAVAENGDLFLGEYARYRAANANGAAGRGAYVIDLASRRWNAENLGRRLAAQGITVLRRDGPATACGVRYERGYLAVPQAQPAARLVRSLLDRDTPLPRDFVLEQERRRDQGLEHELYDVTAWSVGMMSGVDVDLCATTVDGALLEDTAPIAPVAEGSGTFGVALPWTDSGQARLLTLALREGVDARSSQEAFTMEGRTFPRGSVIFPAGSNTPEQMARLGELAREVGAHTVALQSSWVDEGPNLGSAEFVRLALPRVAMAWDEGISQLSAGAMRFVLERRLGLPVVPIRTAQFARADLSEYDVLIVPDGSPGRALGSAGLATVREFVSRGGVMIAISNAINAFAAGDEALIDTAREAALGRDPAKEGEDEGPGLAKAAEISDEAAYQALIEDQSALPDTLPGALLNTVADPENFLSAGYDNGAIVLASGSDIFTPLDRSQGVNVMRFANAESLVASGYVWEENRRQLAFKPYMMAQRSGRGLTIGFAQDPSTRAYLDGLDLLIANAVLIAPARMR